MSDVLPGENKRLRAEIATLRERLAEARTLFETMLNFHWPESAIRDWLSQPPQPEGMKPKVDSGAVLGDDAEARGHRMSGHRKWNVQDKLHLKQRSLIYPGPHVSVPLANVEAEINEHNAAVDEIVRLRAGAQAVLNVDSEMGIYPAAVRGATAEQSYEQRDGYKNGWNACAMEYGHALRKLCHALGVDDNIPADEEYESELLRLREENERLRAKLAEFDIASMSKPEEPK